MNPEGTGPTTDHRGHVGVLVSNLGTPEAPTSRAVRKYLRQFLSDRRVVDLPRFFWMPILYGFILPLRPGRSAALYQKIWTPSGSPLQLATTSIGEKLTVELEKRTGMEVPVAIGMRYGSPSLASAVNRLKNKGCSHIVALPLYPQYSETTTGSTVDEIGRVLSHLEDPPPVQTINQYHSDPGYISSLATSVRELWDRDGAPDQLLLSFHGLPQRYADAGDPYPQQCESTANRLAEALKVDGDRWKMSYQSRFGREAWLEPATHVTLEKWGRENLGSVDVLCPGFATDCLETLEEIAITGRKIYEGAGGNGFRYISALNDRQDHVNALADLVTARVQR